MEPVYGSPARWIGPDLQDEAAIAGATVVTPMEVLSTHLMEVVKSNLSVLLTMSDAAHDPRACAMSRMSIEPQLNQRFFDGMVPDKVAPELLLTVLRGMLDDGAT